MSGRKWENFTGLFSLLKFSPWSCVTSATACSTQRFLTQKRASESPCTPAYFSKTNTGNAYKHINILQSIPKGQVQLLELVFLKVTDVPNRSQLSCYFTIDKNQSKICSNLNRLNVSYICTLVFVHI